jgi:hypothetical protein
MAASVVHRTVTCVSSTGETVADSFCPAYTKPSSYLNCLATPLCGPYEGKAHEGNNAHLEELAPMKDEAAGSAIPRNSIIIGSALGATVGLAGLALCVSYSKRSSKSRESLPEGMIDA